MSLYVLGIYEEEILKDLKNLKIIIPNSHVFIIQVNIS